MKKKPIVLLLLVFFLISCVNKKSSEHQDSFARKIELEGQVNFRDLGNYSTIDGKKIETGLLFRSGALSKLTESDKNVIKELGIKTVINFLSEEEIATRGADNLPAGVNSVYLPISGENNETHYVLEARRTGDFSKVPVELNYNFHSLLPEVAKDGYSRFLKLLADSANYPIVFHYSHGVHRTGTASALVLSMLEVPWPQIESDYLLSNEFRF